MGTAQGRNYEVLASTVFERNFSFDPQYFNIPEPLPTHTFAIT